MRQPFIVEGIISASSTLIYGEAKVGKSFLVSSLVASLVTGSDFLGREVEDRDWKVAICWTDDDGVAEYGERIATVLPDGIEPAVRFYGLPVMRTRRHWEALFARVMADGSNFLVIDNLSQASRGSLNDDNAVKDFFDGVRIFTRAGIPVVIVGHSSEKRSDTGNKSDLPLGSSVISQSVRWRCFYSRSRGKVNVRFSGNHAEAHSMTLDHGVGARFTVVEKKDAQAVKDEQQERTRTRDSATLDRNADIARWVVAECQGKGRNAAAEAIAGQFGGTLSTAKTHLSKRSAYGCLLAPLPGNRWALAGPLAA